MKQAYGIDISKWQGRVDWDRLAAQHKAGRLDFILLRAGYGGGTVDPMFAKNYAGARAAGIPCGAYWYAYWGRYTPAQEAQSFLRAVAGKRLEYGLWYDVEYEPDILALGRKERTDKVLEGLHALAASGRYVGLYASTDMVNNRLEYGRLREYDLWCAQYAARNTCKLPYGLWQYTSGGSVEGIAGRVDCNRAYKDYPAFVAGPLAGETAEDKPEQDTPAGGSPNGAGASGPAGGGEAGGRPEGPAAGGSPNGAGGPAQGTGPAGGGAEGPAGAQPAPGQEEAGVQPAPSVPPGEDEGARGPRETHTWRITGEGKADADRLLALCDKLGLYTLGTVEVQHGNGPVELLSMANRLALGTGCTMRIGPATRGDLAAVFLEAGSLGLPLRWSVDVGPVSTGDTVPLKGLAAGLGCGWEEVA